MDWDDILEHDHEVKELAVLLKGPDVSTLAGQNVTRLRLRGTWTSGEHQELLCTLTNGTFVRISRNNGSDTFQVGALEEGGKSMPDLCGAEPNALKQPYAVAKLLRVFTKIHGQIPRYDHGDCHVFAQRIYTRVTGINPQSGSGKGQVNATVNANEDDFF